MKSILSVVLTAVLMLSALTACGANRMASRTEEARVTPSPTTQSTERPMTTNMPNATSKPSAGKDDNALGEGLGNAARDAGNAVGNAVEGAGEAMGDMVDDMRDGMDGHVTDQDGVIGNERGN